MLKIIQIPVLTDNYIYLLHDTASGITAVVDPALSQPVFDELNRQGWQLDWILNTHHHADHVGGNLELKAKTGCQVIAANADKDRIPGFDKGVDDGDVIKIGQYAAKVLASPGHTSGHIVYYFADSAALFCGDTLFAMGCGRLFEGSAEQMWRSLQKIKALPGDTRIYCAHEYTQANGRFALTVEPENLELQQRIFEVGELRARNQPTVPSTLQQELDTNPFLREDSLALQRQINREGETPVSVFTEVRRLKDHF
ncbi:MAG: hydroxyacylglutathione hydrolase [Methylococcaceae bacterium]|nr:hydroxyacylglutathione hydrolase [Methylococcaceae bacterium]MDZ4155506.1 hydroxyacylglutathione hydrolase [Methylococcales bacterium]MDP2395230.1 hydroxyacylglutathione hydrolase [Methylococcaceae bacterium]MDP3020658.1 hydroxyacylglutathione hydrolase [Methylococcaceae bacterium]MDP3390097.1 hydroxyacylglutathione hydrolase [Methylococcaceae bacterium]